MPTVPPTLVRDKARKPGTLPPAFSLPSWFSPYGRLAVAAVLLAGAAYNGLVTLRHPESLRGVADIALFDVYRTFVTAVVLPHAAAFTAVLIAFHLAAALALLARGRVVTFALVAVLVFLLALIPALGVYNTMNIPLLLFVGLLLLRTYPKTVLDELRHP